MSPRNPLLESEGNSLIARPNQTDQPKRRAIFELHHIGLDMMFAVIEPKLCFTPWCEPEVRMSRSKPGGRGSRLWGSARKTMLFASSLSPSIVVPPCCGGLVNLGTYNATVFYAWSTCNTTTFHIWSTALFFVMESHYTALLHLKRWWLWLSWCLHNFPSSLSALEILMYWGKPLRKNALSMCTNHLCKSWTLAGSRIHASPRAWLAGSEQPRRLQDQKNPHFPPLLILSQRYEIQLGRAPAMLVVSHQRPSNQLI